MIENKMGLFEVDGLLDRYDDFFMGLFAFLFICSPVFGTALAVSGYSWLGLAVGLGGMLIPVLMCAGILTNVTEGMTTSQQNVYRALKRTRKAYPELELPQVSLDTILNMDDPAAYEVERKLRYLQEAYIKNREATKVEDFRIKELQDALDDKTSFLSQHTETLRALDSSAN